ncbi:MAG: hypothetical protein QG627_1160 [Chlamydiota bacterium]|jgi:hypothetical protein|nr:hypothetical protein [Chlamydiota bacterium]
MVCEAKDREMQVVNKENNTFLIIKNSKEKST